MTNLFEIGDKVCHPLWEGEATIIHNGFPACSENITVRVDDINMRKYIFSPGGQRMGEFEPTLRHAEAGSPCIVGEPPNRPKSPMYIESNLTRLLSELLQM